jgi:NAD(P)-dependent dehydrogenase (short-subunit alcohol dehydrogenase family)
MDNKDMPKTALILGASRGLGLALAGEYLRRGWAVIATARDAAGFARLAALRNDAGGALTVEHLDINQPDQLAALRGGLARVSLDLLFVNAGVSNDPDETIGQVGDAEFMRVMLSNALSPMRAVETLAERVPARGTIAVMSSELGSIAGNSEGGWEVYRASKAALNTLMRSYAARRQRQGDGRGQTLLAVAPGWVRTDMGGADAPLDIATSIRGVADTIAARSGSGGMHFVNYQDRDLPW